MLYSIMIQTIKQLKQSLKKEVKQNDQEHDYFMKQTFNKLNIRCLK